MSIGKNINNNLRKLVLLVLVSVIASCGGGGSSGGGSSLPTPASNATVSSASSSSSIASSNSSSSISSSSSSSSVVPPTSKVEIRVSVDDWAFLTVNGIRHRIGYWQGPTTNTWIDVSEWFIEGVNNVHLQAINYGGQRALDFEMRVDGKTIATAQCPSNVCVGSNDAGSYYEADFQTPSLILPKAGTLNVANLGSNKLYINDEFVTLANPASLQLPQGTYKIGMGVSNENPLYLTDDFYEYILALGVISDYNLEGKFYEKTVSVSANQITAIDMIAGAAPLEPQNTIKIAILPFQSVMSDDMASPLILTQAMVDGFAEQVKVTSQRLALPSMYGLSKWEVTVLPMDTILNVHAATTQDLVGALYSVSYRPEYKHLYDEYDSVVVFQSSYHANGSVEPIFAGGMTTSGRTTHVTSGWTWTVPNNGVNRGFYHEMYHQYENWEVFNHHYYNGLAGLHGQREHGFTGSGVSVQEYYRLFARGQVGEDNRMRAGMDWPTPLRNGQPFPVGVFHAVRYGRLPTN